MMSSSPLWLCLTILGLASIGVVSNVACFVILTCKRRSSMFHNLLKLLSLFDIVVILGCSFLYALPGIPWDYFTLVIYPRCLPFILPLTQISVMASVYCTTLMSFERYIRICHLCQLRYNAWLSERTFKLMIAFVTIFPVLFYFPRFFEMRSTEEAKSFHIVLDCANFTQELKMLHHQSEMLNLTAFGDILKNPVFDACSRLDYEELASHQMVYSTEKKVSVIQLEATWLGENKTYQFVYSSILNTMFSTAMPVILLFYLNLSTVMALSKMKKLQKEDGNTIGLTSHIRPSRSQSVSMALNHEEKPNQESNNKEQSHLMVNPDFQGQFYSGDRGQMGRPLSNTDLTSIEESGRAVLQAAESSPSQAQKWKTHNNKLCQFWQTKRRNSASSPRMQMLSPQNLHKTENRLTRISLAIVWMFIFCHVWKLIPTMYEALEFSSTENNEWPNWLLIINDISHTLIVFNSAVNFLIYSIL